MRARSRVSQRARQVTGVTGREEWSRLRQQVDGPSTAVQGVKTSLSFVVAIFRETPPLLPLSRTHTCNPRLELPVPTAEAGWPLPPSPHSPNTLLARAHDLPAQHSNHTSQPLAPIPECMAPPRST